ncbi:MAG: MarR family transcriptional regulator [Pseudomonadota bacterium]
MGSRWGINRTVGQMYALLYLSEEPLNAEQICTRLDLSRSNVSMGLKELQSWRLVKLKHLPGDRRDYFSTPEDVTEIAITLLEERKKRELDPTMSMLRDTLIQLDNDDDQGYAVRKMREMCDMMEQTSRWADELINMDRKSLQKLMVMGSLAGKVLSFALPKSNQEAV